MHYPAPLVWRTLSWALFGALVAVPLGLLIGTWVGWLFFAVILAFQLGHHLTHLALLDRWSRNPQPDATLEGEGAWDAVFARLYRHEKQLRDEIAVREREIAGFEAAGQALIDGVVLLDEFNHIHWCNETAESQLGIALRSDRSQHIANLVRQPEFVDYLRRQEFGRPLILRPVRREECVLSLHIIPYAGNQRLLQIRDVTKSERLDQMRRDFVANVSHELRTPLTVLAGFLESLQEFELDADERQRYLAMMGDQAQRMQSIVQDLLTLSTLESAPQPGEDAVDMALLLDTLRRDAEALSGGRHRIALAVDGQADLKGEERELVSAFANLVANAVRYTPAGGAVTITWQVVPEGARFSVRDTGIGIPAEHLPRLTERFYRVDRGRSRDSGGTGLGLAIVKHAINRHEAKLQIESQPGQGSAFTVHFPNSRLIRR